MCLAIPGRVVSIEPSNGLRLGKVQFGDIVRQASLDFVPEVGVGDYVVVHVGFAIRKVDAEEAQRTCQLFDEIEALEPELPAEDRGQ